MSIYLFAPFEISCDKDCKIVLLCSPYFLPIITCDYNHNDDIYSYIYFVPTRAGEASPP